MRKLKKRRGYAPIEFIITVFFFFVIIAIFVHIIPIYVNHSKAEAVTRDLIREMSLSGTTAIDAYITSTLSKHNIDRKDVNIVIKPAYRTLHLNQKFSIEVTITTPFKILEFIDVPIEVKIKDEGRSEIYRK